MNNKRIITIFLTIIAIIALALLPSLIKKDSTINLVILVLLYMTIASSWNILGGYTGQTNLGHAAFFGIGSLATRLLWIKGFPFLPSLLIGGVAAVILALLIGVPAFKLRGVYFAIGTLALSRTCKLPAGSSILLVFGPGDHHDRFSLSPGQLEVGIRYDGSP